MATIFEGVNRNFYRIAVDCFCHTLFQTRLELHKWLLKRHHALKKTGVSFSRVIVTNRF